MRLSVPTPLLILLTLSACMQAASAQTEPPLVATVPAPPTPPPSPTLDPITPSPFPTATATPFPHPMSIEEMRLGSYPGSAVEVVEEFARGSKYSRYYVYYLSEGLKIYALLTIPDGEA